MHTNLFVCRVPQECRVLLEPLVSPEVKEVLDPRAPLAPQDPLVTPAPLVRHCFTGLFVFNPFYAKGVECTYDGDSNSMCCEYATFLVPSEHELVWIYETLLLVKRH